MEFSPAPLLIVIWSNLVVRVPAETATLRQKFTIFCKQVDNQGMSMGMLVNIPTDMLLSGRAVFVSQMIVSPFSG